MIRLKAFTMAEAILVMTILGIIATIMISTLKPAQYKEQAFKVLSKSIYAEIDSAITEILTNHTRYNDLKYIYEVDDNYNPANTIFDMSDSGQGDKFVKIMKKYMATARGSVPSVCSTVVNYDNNANILLKNGACIAIKSGSVGAIDTWIPGEEKAVSDTGSYGMIYSSGFVKML